MPITNLSSVTYTDTEITVMNSAITAQQGVIDPKSTNLGNKEKQLYGSIAEENKLMVQKILDYVDSVPAVLPEHVDKDELIRDYTSRNQLEKWENAVAMLQNNIQNTKILLDYDVYQACLSIYRNVRYKAGEDVAGMAAIYDDLKQFFPGGRPADAPTEPSK